MYILYIKEIYDRFISFSYVTQIFFFLFQKSVSVKLKIINVYIINIKLKCFPTEHIPFAIAHVHRMYVVVIAAPPSGQSAVFQLVQSLNHTSLFKG